MDVENRRGVLYPERLPEFHRVPAPAVVSEWVTWFWVPEWRLPDGVTITQEVLPFPACNLVVEPTSVSVVGPPTRRSCRVLEGAGWAVGALLRPAAVPALAPDPARLRDSALGLAEPALLDAVTAAMAAPEKPGDARRGAAVAAMTEWLRETLPEPDADGLLANRLAELLANPAITRVDQLAAELHVSTRTLQRVAARSFGLSLHSMIQRRRLQEAAEELRAHTADDLAGGGAAANIADIAAATGYADHAHFTRDFKAVLGMTPREYRSRARGA